MQPCADFNQDQRPHQAVADDLGGKHEPTDGTGKANPNQGGPADLQTDAVASVEIGLGHFVGGFLLIFPHPG